VYLEYPFGQQITAGSFNTVFHLGGSWTSGEFNVFGYCCASQAAFSGPIGTSLTVQLDTYQGDDIPNYSPMAANCAQTGNGFTGETNNLQLGSCSSRSTGISFTESLNVCDSNTCPNGCCDANNVCHTPGNVNSACGNNATIGCDVCFAGDNGSCRSCPQGFICLQPNTRCPR
jgi:hypothetical protein